MGTGSRAVATVAADMEWVMTSSNELASYDGHTYSVRGAPNRGVGSPPMMAQDPRVLEWLRGLKRQGRTLADAIQELINDMVP